MISVCVVERNVRNLMGIKSVMCAVHGDKLNCLPFLCRLSDVNEIKPILSRRNAKTLQLNLISQLEIS